MCVRLYAYMFIRVYAYKHTRIIMRVCAYNTRLRCTLPNSVRLRALHISRLACIFCNIRLTFICLFPFSSYKAYIPKILTGLCNHFNCKGLVSFFSHFPSKIAFGFLGFNFNLRQERAQYELEIKKN